MNFFNLILKISVYFKEVRAFATLLSKLKTKTMKDLMFKVIESPEEVAEVLGNLNTAERKAIAEEVQDAVDEGGEVVMLKSSWMLSGIWEPYAQGQVGNLSITLKSGKSYTYPGVPLTVWDAMKRAPGGYNKGAGTQFWALYLRGAKTTTGYNQVALAFKLAGVGGRK